MNDKSKMKIQGLEEETRVFQEKWIEKCCFVVNKISIICK